MLRGKKIFIPLDPIKLLQKARDQVRRAGDLVKELRTLNKAKDSSLIITTKYGPEALFETLCESAERAAKVDSIVRIIGGAHGHLFFNALGRYWPSYSRLVKELNIKKYLISSAKIEEEYKENFLHEPQKGNRLRLFKQGISAPSWTRISPGLVSFEMYNDEVVVIQIRSETYAQAYQEHFQLLWEMGTEAKQSSVG